MGGYKYFVTWIDHKTWYACVDFLKNKECTTVTRSFVNYAAWIKQQIGSTVKKVRTDNGGEYTGREFTHLCEEQGIVHETTSPHTPEHNGIAERYNRVLQEGALTMQHDAGLSGRFWISSIHTANFVKNRVLHTKLGISPYEAFWGSKPKVDWLRTYGSRCWALVPKVTRKKGDYKSIEGIFIGYYDNSKAYKIWIPETQTVMKVRDVIFDESHTITRTTIHSADSDDIHSIWGSENIRISTGDRDTDSDTQEDDDNAIPPLIDNEHIVITQGSDGERFTVTPRPHSVTEIEARNDIGSLHEIESGPAERNTDVTTSRPEYTYQLKHAPKDFSKGPWIDPDNTEYGRGKRHTALMAEVIALANGETDLEETEKAFVVLAEDEPSSYKEAMRSENVDRWKEACIAEYGNLTGYNTWTLVEPPPNTNIVGSRWTFRIKRDNLGQIDKFKARVVAQGYSQIPGIDFQETYSPTLRLTSIRLILALACRYDMELRQINVKGAYLNGKLNDIVYMKQPEGFVKEGEEHLVCQLNKGMYGLKQSGRVWHQTLKHELEKLGFEAGKADPTIFFRFHDDGNVEMGGWYINDGLLAATTVNGMETMVEDIKGSFDIQDLGNPTRLLGIRIERDRNLGFIHISQPSFISSITN